jgi:pimeloyl-ACP methyl ester carboxylesterase
MSHGAWAWDLLRTRLERAGHRVVVLDLPGHGRRAHERARASIDGYARAVVDAMTLAGVSRAILVGGRTSGASSRSTSRAATSAASPTRR